MKKNGVFSGYNCQKMKHCFIFIVYNDVRYHIPSAVIFQNGKVIKPRWPMHRAETDLGKEIYNQREMEEEDRRDRTSYIDYSVYLIFIL